MDERQNPGGAAMNRDCARVFAHLTAYALGDLSDPEVRRMETHLSRCPECQSRLESIRHELASLQTALKETPAPSHLDPNRRRAIFNAARAAALRPTTLADRLTRLLDRLSAPWQLAPTAALSFALLLLIVVAGAALWWPALVPFRGSTTLSPSTPSVLMPETTDSLGSDKDWGGRPSADTSAIGPSDEARTRVPVEMAEDMRFAAGEPLVQSYGGVSQERRLVPAATIPPPTPPLAKPARPSAPGEIKRKAAEKGESLLSTSESQARRQREEATVGVAGAPHSAMTFERAAPSRFNPFVETAQQPFSTFSIDVDTASYTLSRLALLNGNWPPPEAVRVEEFINFFDYHYPAPLREAFALHADGGPSPFGPGLRLLRIGVQGRRTGREGQKRSVLTLLVDTSGSMSTPDRLGLVQSSLRLLLDQLHPQDQVALLSFDSQARLVLDYTPAAQKETLRNAIAALQASGSTHLEAGLRLAFASARAAFDPNASNRILLFSDGAANLGGSSAEELLALISDSRRQGLFLTVFGVGYGGVHDELLEQLADKGDGTYLFLDSIEEARRLFVDQLAATLHTIAADVKIQVEFNPQRVRLYRQIGYDNRQLTKEQFRDDRVDAGEVGAGQSVTALYELDLVPDAPADAPLGTVRLRYRDVDANRIVESAIPLPASVLTDRADALSASFLLAACAAEFAEILRGSPFAADSSLDEVANRLRPVVAAFSLDPRVRELLDLVLQARSLENRSP
jgi:Ca-activated chloride channel family protein